MEPAPKTSARKEKRLVLFPQVQERLGGRSRTYVYDLVKAGKLPRGIKIGRSRAWFEHEIAAFLNNLEAA